MFSFVYVTEMPTSLPAYHRVFRRRTLVAAVVVALLCGTVESRLLAAKVADTTRRSVITTEQVDATSTMPAPTSTKRTNADEPIAQASDPLEKAKVSEIVGEPQQDRRVRRFFELVVLPFGVCILLAMVLRRGFLE